MNPNPGLTALLSQALQIGALDSNDDTLAHAPAANVFAQVTFAPPGIGFRWMLLGATAFYTVAPAAPQSLTVESIPLGGVKLREIVNGANTPTRILMPVIGNDNEALQATLAAGGAGVSGRLSVMARKTRTIAV